MNYKKIYELIIEKYKQLNFQKLNRSDKNYIYLETHHIMPRCMNGTDDLENLVNLPAREHFICHLLLPKIYKGTEFEYKLWTAAHRFIYGNDMKNKIRITSDQYRIIRENFSKLRSEANKGEGNPNYGNRWTEEQRKNLSRQKKGKSLEELVGKERAIISKKKMSISQKNRKHKCGYRLSEETRRLMSINRKGKKKSEEFKKKCSQRMKGNTYGKVNKGRKMTLEQRKHLSEVCKGRPGWNKGKKLPSPSRESIEKRRQTILALHRKCSKETKLKMGNRARELRSKLVLCVETGIIFDGYMKAAFITKIKNIGKCCLGKIESAGGYHWIFLDKPLLPYLP